MTEVLGSIVPRLYTPPLIAGPPGPCGCGCALTPETSYGFAAADFAANRLKRPAWPWQRWLFIHGGELLDGAPRFRRLIVTVGRQSGKTYGVEDLTLFWLTQEKHKSILGTSTLTKYAKKPWRSSFSLAAKMLPDAMPMDPFARGNAIRNAAGEEEWWTADGCTYAISASNAEGGRSMSNQRVIADEFAKQYNYDAYSAAYPSMDAFENAQFWALTTPDAKGEPYRDLRDAALKFVETGEGDFALGLFEWSAPADCDPTDPASLAASNPTMNRPGGKSGARLVREAKAAVAKGGALLETFKTEYLCILLEDADAAIDMDAWKRGLQPMPLDALRSRLALCFDVAPSLTHATLYVAATLPDGRVRIEGVQEWTGRGCVDKAVRELKPLVEKVRPRLFGWLPTGPAAGSAAKLSRLAVPGVEFQEIRGELTQVSMGFSQLVSADKILHSGDPLLDDQAETAIKQKVGDAWRFSRKEGDADALYAAAGATWLAQTIPAEAPRMRVLLPTARA